MFNEPWPVTMVGLDLTHQALATPEVVERIARVGTTPAQFVLSCSSSSPRPIRTSGLRRTRPYMTRARSRT